MDACSLPGLSSVLVQSFTNHPTKVDRIANATVAAYVLPLGMSMHMADPRAAEASDISRICVTSFGHYTVTTAGLTAGTSLARRQECTKCHQRALALVPGVSRATTTTRSACRKRPRQRGRRWFRSLRRLRGRHGGVRPSRSTVRSPVRDGRRQGRWSGWLLHPPSTCRGRGPTGGSARTLIRDFTLQSKAHCMVPDRYPAPPSLVATNAV
jgi:hypothetical protein